MSETEPRNWGTSDHPLTEAEVKALPAGGSGETREPHRVRAKFTVIEHKKSLGGIRNPETGGYSTGVWHAVVLQAVAHGSPENEQFYAATPNGRIEMAMVSADAAAQFPIGAEVYVDFTIAE